MLSSRVQVFSESVIREMSRLAARFGALNLAQGMPDFDAPAEVKQAAVDAINAGYNQYAVTWGAPDLRKAIAEKAAWFNGIHADPETQITVCCGATECMMATMLALIDPGDEVIMFQPFYENYGPDTLLSNATPVYVNLHEPDWSLDPAELRRAFTNKTKAIIINTPNNPTGRVLTRDEMQLIADLCIQHDVIAITDEIYEHIIYNHSPHISIATLPGMAERTVTISGLSKTFSITGWRLGYCIAPPEITTGIRRVHDFLTVGAPHPLQMAGAAAMRLPRTYYDKLKTDYARRRSILVPALADAGLKPTTPEGAYYVMTDIGDLWPDDDASFVRWMTQHAGLTAVPASSFYNPRSNGAKKVRFMYAKSDAVLTEAAARIRALPAKLAART